MAMKLGIIGCGKMGTALVGGAVRSGAVASSDVMGVDVHQEAREKFIQSTGGAATESIADLAACEVVLLCTKPQGIKAALEELADAVGSGSMLVISIAAGITVKSLEEAAGDTIRVIRAMPNTPALVGKGAAGYCLGTKATAEDGVTAEGLLSAVGMAVEVSESLMDAVTGLSGSGPAYVYLMIEALADGGVKQGIPKDEALRLATQTVLGAAAMVQETGMDPADLRDMVTSPGGTTLAGLSSLNSSGFAQSCIDAVAAATNRAKELGQ